MQWLQVCAKKPNRTRYAGLRFGSEEQQSECAISFVMKRKNSSQAIRRLRRVVRLKGFEPPTFWFVAKHSIQLSYSRIPQEKYLSLTAYK